MNAPVGFKAAQRRVLQALRIGAYQHEARRGINQKNLLQSGQVAPEEVYRLVAKCNGTHHESSQHHQVSSVTVHVLRRDGWYIKFYFLDPDTIFISVHQ